MQINGWFHAWARNLQAIDGHLVQTKKSPYVYRKGLTIWQFETLNALEHPSLVLGGPIPHNGKGLHHWPHHWSFY